MTERRGPKERFTDASGLRLRVLVWEPEGEVPASAQVDTLLLLHGYLDCAGTFDALVQGLPRWLRVVAPDQRGHGVSARVGHASWYHYFDYVRDVRAVVDGFAPGRLAVLGHSMGGGVATLFAGTWPEQVARLVLIEGLGPPAENFDDGPARLKRWVGELGGSGPKGSAPFPDLDEVARRLARQNGGLDEDRARELAGWLAEETDDGARWRHDPWHRARSPLLYRPERYAPFLAALLCPVLTVTGGRSWYRWDDLDVRRAHIADRRHHHFEALGHNIHYEAPKELAGVVMGFLDGRR